MDEDKEKNGGYEAEGPHGNPHRDAGSGGGGVRDCHQEAAVRARAACALAAGCASLGADSVRTSRQKNAKHTGLFNTPNSRRASSS